MTFLPVVARTLRTFMLLALACACSGSGPTTPPVVTAPREALPELRSLSIVFTNDAPPASQTVASSVTAIDHRGQPMTVGLVAWTSSDPTVATIGSDGTILARRQGVTSIMATVGLVSSRRTLTVLPPPPGPLPVASVAVTPLTTTLGVGQSQPMVAKLRDFAGAVLTDREVLWTSSNDTIVVVSATGVVTARAEGTAVVEAVSEGRRSGAVLTVKAAVDTSVIVTIALPVNGATFADTVPIFVTVKSIFPLDSVVAVVAGRSIPLDLVLISNIAGTNAVPTWQSRADISSVAYGTFAIVITATDTRGRRGLAVVSVVRNPVLTPGSKSPPASK